MLPLHSQNTAALYINSEQTLPPRGEVFVKQSEVACRVLLQCLKSLLIDTLSLLQFCCVVVCLSLHVIFYFL